MGFNMVEPLSKLMSSLTWMQPVNQFCFANVCNYNCNKLVSVQSNCMLQLGQTNQLHPHEGAVNLKNSVDLTEPVLRFTSSGYNTLKPDSLFH